MEFVLELWSGDVEPRFGLNRVRVCLSVLRRKWSSVEVRAKFAPTANSHDQEMSLGLSHLSGVVIYLETVTALHHHYKQFLLKSVVMFVCKGELETINVHWLNGNCPHWFLDSCY